METRLGASLAVLLVESLRRSRCIGQCRAASAAAAVGAATCRFGSSYCTRSGCVCCVLCAHAVAAPQLKRLCEVNQRA